MRDDNIINKNNSAHLVPQQQSMSVPERVFQEVQDAKQKIAELNDELDSNIDNHILVLVESLMLRDVPPEALESVFVYLDRLFRNESLLGYAKHNKYQTFLELAAWALFDENFKCEDFNRLVFLNKALSKTVFFEKMDPKHQYRVCFEPQSLIAIPPDYNLLVLQLFKIAGCFSRARIYNIFIIPDLSFFRIYQDNPEVLSVIKKIDEVDTLAAQLVAWAGHGVCSIDEVEVKFDGLSPVHACRIFSDYMLLVKEPGFVDDVFANFFKMHPGLNSEENISSLKSVYVDVLKSTEKFMQAFQTGIPVAYEGRNEPIYFFNVFDRHAVSFTLWRDRLYYVNRDSAENNTPPGITIYEFPATQNIDLSRLNSDQAVNSFVGQLKALKVRPMLRQTKDQANCILIALKGILWCGAHAVFNMHFDPVEYEAQAFDFANAFHKVLSHKVRANGLNSLMKVLEDPHIKVSSDALARIYTTASNPKWVERGVGVPLLAKFSNEIKALSGIEQSNRLKKAIEQSFVSYARKAASELHPSLRSPEFIKSNITALAMLMLEYPYEKTVEFVYTTDAQLEIFKILVAGGYGPLKECTYLSAFKQVLQGLIKTNPALAMARQMHEELEIKISGVLGAYDDPDQSKVEALIRFIQDSSLCDVKESFLAINEKMRDNSLIILNLRRLAEVIVEASNEKESQSEFFVNAQLDIFKLLADGGCGPFKEFNYRDAFSRIFDKIIIDEQKISRNDLTVVQNNLLKTVAKVLAEYDAKNSTDENRKAVLINAIESSCVFHVQRLASMIDVSMRESGLINKSLYALSCLIIDYAERKTSDGEFYAEAQLEIFKTLVEQGYGPLEGCSYNNAFRQLLQKDLVRVGKGIEGLTDRQQALINETFSVLDAYDEKSSLSVGRPRI